mgnify:FL=1
MDYSDFAMFQFTHCGMFRAKNPLYAVVQGVAEDMRADTRSGRAKAIAAFLCPSAESEPSLNGSLLSQIQLVSSFSYIVFSGSDHSVSVVC